MKKKISKLIVATLLNYVLLSTNQYLHKIDDFQKHVTVPSYSNQENLEAPQCDLDLIDKR